MKILNIETLPYIGRNFYNLLLPVKASGYKMVWYPFLWSDTHIQNKLSAENLGNKKSPPKTLLIQIPPDYHLEVIIVTL